MFVSNHPYEAGMPHVSDMGFVAPIFADGMLIGFSGSIAHKADIGGTNPGSTSANATEMFHEGLLLPPVKICRAGAYDEDLERLILANQPPAGSGARRHARADRRDADGRRAHDRSWRALRRRHVVMGAFARHFAAAPPRNCARRSRALPDGEPLRRKAIWTTTASSSTSRSNIAVTITVAEGRDHLRLLQERAAGARARSTCARRWSRPACSIR